MKKRVVVKVGTKVLTNTNNELDRKILGNLVRQIVALRKKDIEVVLVSSGAMGAGRSLMKLKRAEKSADKQVLSAVGQAHLMSAYSTAFKKHHTLCAQVLATKEDFRDRNHYLNMRTCFENLLQSGVVPVVNENDVVATTELLFTDNDELAGLVASQINADTVIILSSVPGLLVEDTVVSTISHQDLSKYQKHIEPTKTEFGRGGMLTKFAVAKKLTLQGIQVILADGRENGVLEKILSDASIGTTFLPAKKASAIKRRIAHSEALTKGSVTVNTCAEELFLANERVMSVLPVGCIKLSGDFHKGDIIEVLGESGTTLGYGIAEYGAERAEKFLGQKRAKPIIHYNHLFIAH